MSDLITIRVCGRPKTIEAVYNGEVHKGQWVCRYGVTRILDGSHGQASVDPLLCAALEAWGGQREFTITPQDLLAVAKEHSIPLKLKIDHLYEDGGVVKLDKNKKVGYTSDLHPTRQIAAEEHIAQMLFYDDAVEVSEERANELGRDILYDVLREFCPRLFDDYKEKK
jgi:hypothetical protein